jgi:hypothetical protein
MGHGLLLAILDVSMRSHLWFGWPAGGEECCVDFRGTTLTPSICQEGKTGFVFGRLYISVSVLYFRIPGTSVAWFTLIYQ